MINLFIKEMEPGRTELIYNRQIDNNHLRNSRNSRLGCEIRPKINVSDRNFGCYGK